MVVLSSGVYAEEAVKEEPTNVTAEAMAELKVPLPSGQEMVIYGLEAGITAKTEAVTVDEKNKLTIGLTDKENVTHTFVLDTEKLPDELKKAKVLEEDGFMFLCEVKDKPEDTEYLWQDESMLVVAEQSTDKDLEKPVERYTTTAVNLRKEASSKTNVLMTVPEGTKVTVKGGTAEWCRIEVAGKEGYMFRRYLADDMAKVKELKAKKAAAKPAETKKAEAASNSTSNSSNSNNYSRNDYDNSSYNNYRENNSSSNSGSSYNSNTSSSGNSNTAPAQTEKTPAPAETTPAPAETTPSQEEVAPAPEETTPAPTEPETPADTGSTETTNEGEEDPESTWQPDVDEWEDPGEWSDVVVSDDIEDTDGGSSDGGEVYEVSRETIYDCDDSGSGYYFITYSDGSVATEDF